MLKSRKKYLILFLVLSFAFFLFVGLFFVDPYSPFSFVTPLQDLFFTRPFGEGIFAFFLPGIRIAQFLVDSFFEPLVCPFFNGCPGRYDGSPIDSYFFFPLTALFVGILYAGAFTGIVRGIYWVRSHNK